MSGRFVQRVPRSLRAQLIARARAEGVSLNTLVGQYEAAGFTLTSLAGVTGSVITYNPQDPT